MSRPIEVGDYVRLLRPHHSDVPAGTILRVSEPWKTTSVWCTWGWSPFRRLIGRSELELAERPRPNTRRRWTLIALLLLAIHIVNYPWPLFHPYLPRSMPHMDPSLIPAEAIAAAASRLTTGGSYLLLAGGIFLLSRTVIRSLGRLSDRNRRVRQEKKSAAADLLAQERQTTIHRAVEEVLRLKEHGGMIMPKVVSQPRVNPEEWGVFNCNPGDHSQTLDINGVSRDTRRGDCVLVVQITGENAEYRSNGHLWSTKRCHLNPVRPA